MSSTWLSQFGPEYRGHLIFRGFRIKLTGVNFTAPSDLDTGSNRGVIFFDRGSIPVRLDPFFVARLFPETRLGIGRVRAIIVVEKDMIETTYRDLAEFGLPLITPGEPAFNPLLEAIRSNPRPFGPKIEGVPDRAAILENLNESPVVTLTYVWRYTPTSGKTRTSSYMNLGSSRQIDVLTGREKAALDLYSFILPGSRRLITEQRMFGDNRDVLAQQPAPGGGIWGGGGTGRGWVSRQADDEVVRIELVLDVAIFEDGLCVGPDERGLRESLTQQMERQKEVADQIVRALRDGATRGGVFEMLQPVARHRPPAPPDAMTDRDPQGHHHTPLLSMFARSALNQLVNGDDATLLSWFEAAGAISPRRLRRP